MNSGALDPDLLEAAGVAVFDVNEDGFAFDREDALIADDALMNVNRDGEGLVLLSISF